MADFDHLDECFTCAEDPEGHLYRDECPASKRPCGHHCNCSWIQDCCHWCGAESDDDGELVLPREVAS